MLRNSTFHIRKNIFDLMRVRSEDICLPVTELSNKAKVQKAAVFSADNSALIREKWKAKSVCLTEVEVFIDCIHRYANYLSAKFTIFR